MISITNCGTWGLTYDGYQHQVTNTYDYHNRLTNSTATAVSPGTVNYNLSYNYDPWGNMSCTSGGTGVCPQYSYGINGNYSTTNQITNSGYTYDAAGNLTADGTGTGAYTYTYDGEGRLTVVSSSTLTFLYNVLVQREMESRGFSIASVPPLRGGDFQGMGKSIEADARG